MGTEFQVGDSGTIVVPGDSVDADLPDDRWYQFTPTASYTESTAEPTPSVDVQQGDTPHPEDKPPAGTNMDEWASGILVEAWQKLFNEVPTPKALQAVQAIARLESKYGWPNPDKFPNWQGHHNWGSVHCLMRVDGKLRGCLKDGVCVKGFMGKDTINGVRKDVCFASFPTNVDGAAHFLTTLLVRRPNVKAVIDSGSAYRIALEMRKTRYFFRQQSNDLDVIKSDAAYYAGAIMDSAQKIAANRKVQLLLSLGVPEDVKPSKTQAPSWPRDVTNVGDYSPPTSLGPTAGLIVGIGLGLLGMWGYRKWVK